MITLNQIATDYKISPRKLKNIRSKPNFNFPSNLSEQGFTALFDEKEVASWFEQNKSILPSISTYSNMGNGKTLDNLLAFYNRNFCRLKGSGGGESKTVKIRPSIEDHWDNEHQRGGFNPSFGTVGLQEYEL